MKSFGVATVVVALVIGAAPGAIALEPADSPRLARAKDLISEERWAAAIPELRAAVTDPKERNKDEALFWLAHSQNQAGDLAEAVESIRKLQSDSSEEPLEAAGRVPDDRARAEARTPRRAVDDRCSAVAPAAPALAAAAAIASRVTTRAAASGRTSRTGGAERAHAAGPSGPAARQRRPGLPRPTCRTRTCAFRRSAG